VAARKHTAAQVVAGRAGFVSAFVMCEPELLESLHACSPKAKGAGEEFDPVLLDPQTTDHAGDLIDDRVIV